jgi:hypothetical protein
VVLGSAWAARAVARAGAPTGSDATLLPGSAQVSGLHDVIAIVQVMILVGLALVATDLLRRRRDGSRRRSPPTDVASPGRVR